MSGRGATTRGDVGAGPFTGLDLDGAADLLSPAWTAWTPTVFFGATEATYGTGNERAGEYVQIGKTVIGRGQAQFGASPTIPTGFLMLPFPVAPAGVPGNLYPIGVVTALAPGGVTGNVVLVPSISATKALIIGHPGTDGFWDQDTPVAWAETCEFAWSMMYQAA